MFARSNTREPPAHDPWAHWSRTAIPPRCSLRHEGRAISGAVNKARAFRQFFAAKHARSTTPVDDGGQTAAPLDDAYPAFTLVELRAAIAAVPLGASDPFGLNPRMLAALPRTTLAAIANLATDVLRSGECPESWRDSTVVPLLKPGKRADELRSYRPVSLTSLLCRITERMLLLRIAPAVERFLDAAQVGSRRGGSPDIVLGHLLADASTGFGRVHRSGTGTRARRQEKTLLCLLDCSDAFCRARPEEIVSGLRRAGLRPNEVSFVGSFLCRRTMRVRLDGTTTRPVPLMAGVPQGAVLSPLLWAVFLDPLLRRLRDASKPSIGRAKGTFAAYADDVTLWATAHEAALARGSIAAMLGVATAWLGEREVAVSEKTECLVLSGTYRSAPLNGWCLPVPRGDGGQLQVRRGAARVLGVIVDTALTFREHARHLRAAVAPDREALKPLSTKLRRHCLAQLYSGCPLARITNAAPIWWPHAATDTRRYLERLHGQFCRMIAGCIATTSTAAALGEAGFPSLDAIIAKRGAKVAARLLGMRDALPSAKAIVTCSTPATFGACFATPYAAGDARHEPLPLHPLLDPAEARDHHVRISWAHDSTRATDPVPQRKACNDVCVSSAGAYDLLLATDGGVKGEASVGAAVLFAANGDEIACAVTSAGTSACSFSAEQVGMELGMGLVEQALLSLPPHPHVLVLSDSQGYLAALAQGPLRQRTHRGARLWARLSACPARITLRHVFAHVGTPANEAADALVQKSIDSPPLPHPPAWAVDRARVTWTPAMEEDLRRLRVAAPFRAAVLGDEAPWLCRGRSPMTTRADERIIAQLRCGCCGILGGWRHEAPEDCSKCGVVGALARGGEAVRHVFACPSLSALRDSLGIADLSSAPERALRYFRAYLEWAPG